VNTGWTARADSSYLKLTCFVTTHLTRRKSPPRSGAFITGSRKWLESPAKLEEKDGRWHATATLSEGTTAWFINVQSGVLVSSSEFQETSAPSK
jgi:hypothetical protein